MSDEHERVTKTDQPACTDATTYAERAVEYLVRMDVIGDLCYAPELRRVIARAWDAGRAAAPEPTEPIATKDQNDRWEALTARLERLAAEAEPERTYPEELLRMGGAWLGAVRNRIKWLRYGGHNDSIVWGSGESPEPPFTMREVEALAAEAVAAALNERPLGAPSAAEPEPTPLCTSAEVKEAVEAWQRSGRFYLPPQTGSDPALLPWQELCNTMLTATFRSESEVRTEAIADYQRAHEVCGPVHSLRSVVEVRADERRSVATRAAAELARANLEIEEENERAADIVRRIVETIRALGTEREEGDG